MKKTLVDSHVSRIVIDVKNCYQVNLETTSSDELRINASMEGEYSTDLVVNLETEGKSILVSTGFHPNFIFPNDKLSAHKVISIALHIEVPEYKEVVVYGTNSHVEAKGDYRKLTVRLSDGDCKIVDVGETVDVTTQKGDIWLSTASGVVEAASDYGKVFNKDFPKGDKHYMLQSKEGNIYLNKTK
ncbi:hypothetical protein [Flagellimonas meridianipacifica]|uniref:hypothetical protein n=1 Tax=Flagellimonas meridianipacifica TaxID=1080225 RepID=UPI0011B2515E|nr:hypothetical protein [Allomuricauda pacifica]